MSSCIIEKRRLRARCSWPTDDNNGIYRTTRNERSTASPSADYSYLGKTNIILWLVSEKIGGRLSTDRVSVLSAPAMALALCDVLTQQSRRYVLARIDCSCGRCEQGVLRSISGRDNIIYCPVERITYDSLSKYVDGLAEGKK